MDNDILLPQLLKVLNFAAQKHKNQTRKDGKIPYINHPIQVANILAQNGETDISLLSAALLHDTIEDTETSEKEILENFGKEVLQIVLDCTDDFWIAQMTNTCPNKREKTNKFRLLPLNADLLKL